MPPNFFTFSSRRRRGYVVTTVFGVALAATLALSAWRLEVRGLARDNPDRVVHEVSHMRGVKADTIVLSDSVTARAAYTRIPAPGVIPILTNGYLRLAGQYLIFRRFLEHNSTRRMFLFMHPTLLVNNVSDLEAGGMMRYTYIDSVFTRAEEKQILAEAGASPAYPVEPFFERLLKAWSPNHFPKPLSMEVYAVAASQEPVRRDPTPRLPPPLTAQVRYFLDRIQRDCRAHQIECTLVESPTPPGIPRYDMDALCRMYPGFRCLDVHDYAFYPAEAFPDGWHLNRTAEVRYSRVIQARIAPLFAVTQPTWDGGRQDFNREDPMAIFDADSYHAPEPWGAWTSTPSLSMRFQVSTELRGGEIRLGMRVPPQFPDGPTAVAIWLDGVQRVATTLPDAQIREVTFQAGATVLEAGTSHLLEVRIAQVMNLRKLGQSIDPRDLGPGIAYIAYCGGGRCGMP